jgi:hypothetical protein
MKNKFISALLTLTVSGALVFISSCQREDNVQPNNMKVTINGQTSEGCVPIFAGQTINVGSFCMDDVDTNGDGCDDALRITATTTGCWKMTNVKSWFGCSTCMPPMNKAGNPIPGQFPYHSGNISTQTYTFDIPFSALGITGPCNCPSTTWEVGLRGAVHFDVLNTCTGATETGWAAGDRINSKGNWGTFFGFNIKCDDNNQPCLTEETAFGLDPATGICFLQFNVDGDINSNRWGWSNGTYSGDGCQTLQLWAGAGQCNIVTKGTNVGTVTFCRTGSTLTVNYNTTGSYYLKKVHFYAGGTPLPQHCQGPNDPNCNTVAPGHFGYNSGEINTNSHSFTVSVSGNYYVVAHAEVSNFPCPVQ